MPRSALLPGASLSHSSLVISRFGRAWLRDKQYSSKDFFISSLSGSDTVRVGAAAPAGSAALLDALLAVGAAALPAGMGCCLACQEAAGTGPAGAGAGVAAGVGAADSASNAKAELIEECAADGLQAAHRGGHW